MATARPVVSVFGSNADKASKNMTLPCVFSAPLRADLVRTIHSNMNKNRRQANGVKFEAGYDTAAISWGTGRAVARIPRVPGGGTHRAGQGAFGNMCRGGGMFCPKKTWRKWHVKSSGKTAKRHALAAAIAATAVPALVMARGHKVDEVPELPLVLSDDANKIAKTKDASALLSALGAAADLQRAKDSKKIRAGRGKARNRRYVQRKGPIVVHALSKEEITEASLAKSFRNIPGVDVVHVDRLSLLQLAPGGSIGRFAIFTQSAVKRLGSLFGTYKNGSSSKKNYTLPRAMMQNTDISKIINSNEVQSVLKAAKTSIKHVSTRKNPLSNKSILGRLCPYAPAEKRRAALAHKKDSKVAKAIAGKKAKRVAANKAHSKASKCFMKELEAAHNPKVEAADEE